MSVTKGLFELFPEKFNSLVKNWSFCNKKLFLNFSNIHNTGLFTNMSITSIFWYHLFLFLTLSLSFCKYFSVIQFGSLALFSWFWNFFFYTCFHILFSTFSVFVSVLIFLISFVSIMKSIYCCTKHLNWLVSLSVSI